MKDTTFSIEYHLEGVHLSEKLKSKVESRLRKLSQGHRDVTGASVALKETTRSTAKRHVYKARVVLYHKPDNIVGIEKDDSTGNALVGALEAVERQVRAHRTSIRRKHRRHHAPVQAPSPDEEFIPYEEDI